MSLLAYHVGRLTHLEVSLRRSLDQLRALNVSDPTAANALRATRSAADQIEMVWLPLVRRILASDPLSSDARRLAGVGSLQHSLVTVMVGGYGWEAQHDLLSDNTATVTLEEARALGARSNDLPLDVDDPEQLEWLAEQLEIIGRDPALSAAFLENFHDWAELCDHLAAHRGLLLSDIPHSSPTTVATIDAVFSGLGHIARYGLPTNGCPTPSAILPQIDEMQPYSAALVARYMGLEGELLAQVSLHLLQRWLTMPWQATIGEAPTDVHFTGPNTADVLFGLLTADPVATAHFAKRAVDHPDLLFRTADDASLVRQLLLTVTDPANAPATEAGTIIVPLLAYFADGGPLLQPGHEGYDGSWELFLVDLIAPWTMQFSPLDNTWGLSNERQRDLLAFVIDDDRALSRLLQQADVVGDGVLQQLATQGAGALEAFAAYLGMLHQLVVNETVQDEEEALAAFEFVVGLSATALGKLPGLGLAARLAIGGVTKALVAHAPFDPAKAADDAHYLQEYTLTVTAAAVATAVAQGWLQQGALPPGFPMPPVPDPALRNPAADFVERFGTWLQQLPGGADGELADEAARLTYAFIGPAGAGGALAT